MANWVTLGWGLDVLIHDYAEDGNIAGVADELARNVDIEVQDKRRGRRSRYTPLMYAVTSAKAGPEMVRFLLKRGATRTLFTTGPIVFKRMF